MLELLDSSTDFINTAEQAIEFVSHFESAAQIILDVKAMSSETKPIRISFAIHIRILPTSIATMKTSRDRDLVTLIFCRSLAR